MKKEILMVAAGILSGIGLAGIYAIVKEAVRRQRQTIEKTTMTIIEIKDLLQARR